eukprot:1332401-Amorphochlora_amoeboformis.AAC.2
MSLRWAPTLRHLGTPSASSLTKSKVFRFYLRINTPPHDEQIQSPGRKLPVAAPSPAAIAVRFILRGCHCE